MFGKSKLPAEEKLDALIGGESFSENVITSTDLILMDAVVHYKDSKKFDLFRNVGRIFRLPGALRIATYNKNKKTFDDNLIPLVKIKEVKINFKSFVKGDE